MNPGRCNAAIHRFTNIFWAWLAASSIAFSQPRINNEEALMQEFSELDMQSYADPNAVQTRLLEILDQLDDKTMRRAWIRGFTLLDAEHRDKRFQGDYQSLMQEALAFNDLHSYVRLLWIQAKSLQEKAPRSQVTALYAQAAHQACDILRDPILCGGTRMHENEYYFFISDMPEVLTALEKAMNLFDTLQGRSRVYYYRARLYLANVLFRKNEFAKSIEMNEDNLQWFTDNGFIFLADVAAGNIANTLSKMNPSDTQRIMHYFDISEELATRIQDFRQIAYVHLGRGRLLLEQKSPDFVAARQLFEKSFKIYSDLKITDFAAVSKIAEARAWLGMKHTKEAWQAIHKAEHLLTPYSKYDHLLVLEVKKAIAIEEGNYKAANEFLEKYHALWKSQKEDEEARGLEQLSANLNLKVEEQRNRALREQNEKQAAELRTARILLVFGALLLILTALAVWSTFVAWRRNRMLQTSRAKIQRILSTIDEGLLTIDQDQKIGADFSQHLTQIIDPSKPIARQDFVTRVLGGSRLSNDELSLTRAVLDAVLGERIFAWDANSVNLPTEMVRGENSLQIIKIRWIPIFNHEKILSGLLVSLTDVTQERFLERTLGVQKKHIESLPEALKELLQAKPDLTKSLLAKTEALINSMETGGSIEKFLRDLHTYKGEARTLGLRALSHVLHDLETYLQNQAHYASHDAYFVAQLQMVRDRIVEYRSFTDILHQDKQVGSSPDELWLGTLLGELLSSSRQHLRAASLSLGEICMRDGYLDWTSEQQDLLKNFAIHALNNCMDHGFIIPSAKGEQIEKPMLEISAKSDSRELLIEIRDNGAGLNFDKLNEIAKARGFVPRKGESVADLVFQDGVSTAEKVTISSGRGVGLAAVRAEFESLGGRVGIRSHSSGRGTVIWAALPLSAAGRDGHPIATARVPA